MSSSRARASSSLRRSARLSRIARSAGDDGCPTSTGPVSSPASVRRILGSRTLLLTGPHLGCRRRPSASHDRAGDVGIVEHLLRPGLLGGVVGARWPCGGWPLPLGLPDRAGDVDAASAVWPDRVAERVAAVEHEPERLEREQRRSIASSTTGINRKSRTKRIMRRARPMRSRARRRRPAPRPRRAFGSGACRRRRTARHGSLEQRTRRDHDARQPLMQDFAGL